MGTAHKGYIYEAIASVTTSEVMKPAGVVVVQLSDGGSFAGTVEFQRKPPGATAWATVESGSWTEADLPVTKQSFEAHPDTEVRVNVSARTAGTVNVSITSQVMPD